MVTMENTAENIIEIENVSFTYPGAEKKAIDSINLTVKRGEILVIAGQSGCGKSTLLSHMKKNHIPFGKGSGSMYFTDDTGKRIGIEEMSDRDSAAKIGFVGQDTEAQIISDKVWHELSFGLENLGVRNEVMRRRTAEISEFMGIRHLYRKNTAELSGGERQLVMLASVMAMDPQVLILDEPVNQLSPGATTDFLNIITQINRELAVTVVICEQRLSDVLPIADRVALMHDGKITGITRPDKLYSIVEDFRKETGSNPPIYDALPAASRIFIECLSKREDAEKNSEEEPCMPVSVKDGRKLLKELITDGNNVVSTESFNYNSDNESIAGNKDFKPNASNENIIEIVLSAKEISYAYTGRDYVVRNTSLNVAKGSVVAIMGGNGSGKTTLLKCLAGIYRPQTGKVKSAGKVAFLPQEPKTLFTEIKVEDELAEVFENYGKSRPKAYKDKKCETVQGNDVENYSGNVVKKVGEMLDFLELQDVRKHHPYDLSFGQMQRLALGKILLTEPDVLLLDEPTKGLDAAFKQKLGKLIKQLQGDSRTILVITHDMEFAAEFSSHGAFMFDGEIVAYEDIRDFFEGNLFFTTQVSRMTKGLLERCICVKDVTARIEL